MPEIAAIHIVLLALMLVGGIVVGWLARSGRCGREKTAINVGWHEQLSAKRNEHDRLAGQNKSLMEQVSQYMASNTDAKLRAKELSDALKETFERRDELQRQIKDIRSNLEVAVTQRDRLQSDMASKGARGNAATKAIRERDEKIFRLSRELEDWQNRLPPLVERFRIRDEEARQLEADLADARERINSLETMVGSDQTRVEPVDPNALTDGMDASNDSDDVLRDDLKQVKGIGPAIEKTLNEMGILRFNQIAEMSEYDIDRVAQRLKGFRSRIYREDWIGQARDLQRRKTDDRL